MNVVPWIWPYSAAGASRCFAYAFGGNELLLSVGLLILVGLALSLGPVVYRTTVRIQLVLVLFIFATMAVVATYSIRADAWGALANGIAK